MVVPRSAAQLTSDSEFTLFAVTTFKKVSAEFLAKCRERRWTPRDFRHMEGSREEEERELRRLEAEERKLWGEALRLGRTGFGEAAMTWVHALALRVFVETVLRYGLPAEFVCGLVKVCVILLLLVVSGIAEGAVEVESLTRLAADYAEAFVKGERDSRCDVRAFRRERSEPGLERPGDQG